MRTLTERVAELTEQQRQTLRKALNCVRPSDQGSTPRPARLGRLLDALERRQPIAGLIEFLTWDERRALETALS